MGISPVAAVPKVLEQTGLNKEDVDVYEVRLHVLNLKNMHVPKVRGPKINEAFASQFAYCVEQLKVSMEKVNPKYDIPSS